MLAGGNAAAPGRQARGPSQQGSLGVGGLGAGGLGGLSSQQARQAMGQLNNPQFRQAITEFMGTEFGQQTFRNMVNSNPQFRQMVEQNPAMRCVLLSSLSPALYLQTKYTHMYSKGRAAYGVRLLAASRTDIHARGLSKTVVTDTLNAGQHWKILSRCGG